MFASRAKFLPWHGPGHQAGGCDEPDDAALVAAARADPQAFAALYERYAEAVYRYCAFRLGGPAPAEDATNEVFLRALAGLGGYRDGKFIAWLFQIAHNVVVNHYRRHRPTLPLEALLDMADPAPGPDDIAVGRAGWLAVRDALATLSDAQRATVELRVAGWPDAEFAAALGKRPGAVKTLRYRALQHLRSALASEGVKEAMHGNA